MKKMRVVTLILFLCCFFLSSCGFIRFHLPDDQSQEQQQVGCITLYEDQNFRGDVRKFCNSRDFVGADFDDRTSSLKIDCHVRAVDLFEHQNFQGRRLTLSGCQELHYVGYEFDNLLSSFIIYRNQ